MHEKTKDNTTDVYSLDLDACKFIIILNIDLNLDIMATCTHTTTSDSAINLSCPLCLEVFKDATVLMGCGHTFCRRCLKRYDRAHRDLDHMVCPLCRKITKWEAGRVNDLPSNVAVNDVVADCKSKFSIEARLRKAKCSECKLEIKATLICTTCAEFLCDGCKKGHTSTCEGHNLTSVQEILDNIKRSNPTEEDTEEDIHDKIDDILDRSKAAIEAMNSVDEIETVRAQIHAEVAKLREEVRVAYEAHTKRLREDHERIVEEIETLELGSDDDVDVLESQEVQTPSRDTNEDVE